MQCPSAIIVSEEWQDGVRGVQGKCNSSAIKKTKYMIFSRARNVELLSTLKMIANLPIARLTESKFLGVIVDENLTWSRHIKTIQTKIVRYKGLMFKLISQLPLKVRIQINHSFVQSYINYCSLVWGFSTITNIESLFRAQKKGMRAVIPGIINYRYRYRSDSTLPGHTKSYFAKYDILTIQNVIVLNALVFMHKARHFPLDLLLSVRRTVAENSPLPGATHESSNKWLQNISSFFTKTHYNYCR